MNNKDFIEADLKKIKSMSNLDLDKMDAILTEANLQVAKRMNTDLLETTKYKKNKFVTIHETVSAVLMGIIFVAVLYFSTLYLQEYLQ